MDQRYFSMVKPVPNLSYCIDADGFFHAERKPCGEQKSEEAK